MCVKGGFTCYSAFMKDREQLAGVSSLFLSCGYPASDKSSALEAISSTH